MALRIFTLDFLTDPSTVSSDGSGDDDASRNRAGVAEHARVTATFRATALLITYV